MNDTRWLRFELNLSSLLETIEDNVPKFLEVEAGTQPRLHDDDGDPSDEYVHLRSVQFKDKEPFGLVSVHVAKWVHDLAPDDFASHAALPLLPRLTGVRIGRARQTMAIGTADLEASHHLKIALNAPTAEARCVVTDDTGVAIYVADIIYRGDCIKFDIELLQNSSGKVRGETGFAQERGHMTILHQPRWPKSVCSQTLMRARTTAPSNPAASRGCGSRPSRRATASPAMAASRFVAKVEVRRLTRSVAIAPRLNWASVPVKA